MIKTALAPDAVRVLLASALAERLPALGDLGLSGRVMATPPLPRLAPEELTTQGEPNAWDCFIVAEGGIGIASARRTEDGFSFAGVNVGEFARRSLEAACLGELLLGDLEERFTPAFLSSPEDGLFALAFQSDLGRVEAVQVLLGSPDASELELRPWVAESEDDQ